MSENLGCQTDKLIKHITNNTYFILVLYVYKNYIQVYSNNFSVILKSNEDLLFTLAKLRTIEKPVIWTFRLCGKFKLADQVWFRWLNNIKNGDMIKINYDSDYYEEFMMLIDHIRQFRLEKIYIKFRREFDMDIVKIVNDATYANIYYDEYGILNDLTYYTRFED